MSGSFVISLDFEMLWGVRDHSSRNSPYAKNIVGERAAIPRMLDVFANAKIRATWATVGFLFCESKEELLSSIPSEEDRPRARNAKLSNYTYLDEVGRDEADDPYYFAPSLVKMIAETDGQEIGTHTLSHFYCLEPGFELSNFVSDIESAISIAKKHRIELRSIVFPRNQFTSEHVEVCRNFGIKTFRGNPGGWAYKSAAEAQQTSFRRALRLMDAYTGLLSSEQRGGSPSTRQQPGAVCNVPASRFLRPSGGRLSRIHDWHIEVICREMSRAAELDQTYHLWWHPHNFGCDIEDNIAALSLIVEHFRVCSARWGMVSKNMGDFG